MKVMKWAAPYCCHVLVVCLTIYFSATGYRALNCIATVSARWEWRHRCPAEVLERLRKTTKKPPDSRWLRRSLPPRARTLDEFGYLTTLTLQTTRVVQKVKRQLAHMSYLLTLLATFVSILTTSGPGSKWFSLVHTLEAVSGRHAHAYRWRRLKTGSMDWWQISTMQTYRNPPHDVTSSWIFIKIT
jgi:hypothetical protein